MIVAGRPAKAAPRPVPSHPAPPVFTRLAASVAGTGRAVQHATHSVSTPHAGGLGHAVASAIGRAGGAAGYAVHSVATPHQGNVARLAAARARGGDPLHSNYKLTGADKTAFVRLAQAYWARLATNGLLGPGAKFPQIRFEGKAPPGAYAYVIGKTLHAPTPFVTAALRGKGSIGAYAREAIIHEMAHTMQTSAVSGNRPLTEGGAEAYAQFASPAAIPDYHGAVESYKPFVDAINVRESPAWMAHGQFNPRVTHAPLINAPGTPAFAGAMRGLGNFAGYAVGTAGRRANTALSGRY